MSHLRLNSFGGGGDNVGAHPLAGGCSLSLSLSGPDDIDCVQLRFFWHEDLLSEGQGPNSRLCPQLVFSEVPSLSHLSFAEDSGQKP